MAEWAWVVPKMVVRTGVAMGMLLLAWTAVRTCVAATRLGEYELRWLVGWMVELTGGKHDVRDGKILRATCAALPSVVSDVAVGSLMSFSCCSEAGQ